MCVGLWTKGLGRLSPLIDLYKDHSVPGHYFHSFFPSSLHWPQCFLQPWVCGSAILTYHGAEMRTSSLGTQMQVEDQ